ncbi:hypothetical protein SELMODRAFT_185742 [Selaginella moellendorffii]|uniref:Transmembrane protein adipocyte-associated 1 n=1 Tax=Selaginella moellendorffii TaxID=88036 RepID=D8T5V8_SELML|nr:transmembrane protein adipocyte-associated 1 [Selaginella moellendorffii]EFJ08036.1 hypothetical protein SELMODRAFT_185742 [Selaginella moellendorffii]|eukprot:XP_002990992.1 transmembrane protein adipocyte-associated 1 [Selaginella moellendorffii]
MALCLLSTILATSRSEGLLASLVDSGDLLADPSSSDGAAPPSQVSNDPKGCLAFARSNGQHGVLYYLVMLLPVLAFTVFLIARARKCVKKLLQSQSPIMATYYACLWIISILNILWCVLEMKHSSSTSWNLISLLTRFGMVLLEVSVVVFLSQGYLTSTWDALVRTLTFSGFVAAVDALIKAILIFRFGIPLFVAGSDAGDWSKWSFWFLHSLVFSGVYFFILVLPFTRWRDHLPARPAFYNYVLVLFVLNMSRSLGSFILGCGSEFGYCIYSFTNYAYYAFYPPLLYLTFLADYFKEEAFQLEDVYYSEMKDAGYFDADWD